MQPRFAFECQLDKMAEAIGMDPFELRRRNALGSGTRTVNGMRVTSNGFLECLEKVEAASGWRSKFRRMPYGRGVGVAGSMYISGTNYCIYPNEMPQSAVQLKLDRSGRATVQILRIRSPRPIPDAPVRTVSRMTPGSIAVRKASSFSPVPVSSIV